MAEDIKKLLKGVYQVTKTTFNTTATEDKIGSLWFVRDVESDNLKTEIYFGSRKYGECDPSISTDITNIINIIGEGFSDATLTEKIVELENKQDLYVEKVVYITKDNQDTEDPEGKGLEELPYLLFVYSNGTRQRSHIVVTTSTINIASAEKENVVGEETKKNFLKATTTNEYEVNGVDADAAVLQENITVTENVGGVGSGIVFNSGTSVYDVLLQILCKEKWATPATGSTFSTSITVPTITGIKDKDVIEVGTELTISASIGTEEANNTVTASTFTYGYADDNTGTNYTSNKTYTATLSTPSVKSGSKNGIKMSFTQFNGATAETGETSVSKTVNVSDGTNKVTVVESGKTYVADYTTDIDKTFYVATNLKHYYKEDKETDNTISISNPWTSGSTLTPTNSKAISITGAYKYFYGYTEARLDYSDVFTTKESLSTLSSGFTTASTTTINVMTSSDEKPSVVLVIPSNYTITGTKNALGSDVDIDTTWIKKSEIVYVNGNTTTTYYVYIIHSSNSITYKEIKFKK